MAEMTREQAIESLSWLKARLSIGLGGMDKLSPHYKDMVDEVQSIALAIAALRGWVRTADRLPTEADAGVDEEILTIYDDGEKRLMGMDYWAFVAKVPERFPYWLPVPKLPEVDDD